MYQCVQYELSITMYVASIPIKENYQNGCYLTTVSQNDYIFDVP